MKKKVLTITTIALVFSACGGGGSSKGLDTITTQTAQKESASVVKQEEPTTLNTPLARTMEINKTYTINKGDEIRKLSENTQIEFTSDLNTALTTAKLLSGEAEIISAN